MKRKLTALLIVVLGFCAAATAQVDNCCLVDRQCNNNQDWINGFYAFQNGQCAAPSQPQAASPSSGIAPAQIDNCCFAGWQCNNDQDWINGYHAYLNGQCAAPVTAPAQQQVAVQTGNVAPAQIDNCCYAGWQCHTELDWMGGYHAYRDGRCAAPAQTTASVSAQSTSNVGGQVDNCCFTGWQCNNDQDWVNGYVAFQNGQCPGAPRQQSVSGASCCQAGWSCTTDFDVATAQLVASEGFECGPPTVVAYVEGLPIEGTQTFIGQIKAALDLLRHRAPHWFAYIVKGPLKIRGGPWGPGSFAWYGAFNIAPPHAEESTITLAGTLLHEACHVQRDRHVAEGTTDPYDNVAGFSIEENICEVMRVGALKEVDPSRPPNPWLQAALNHYYGNGGTYDLHAAANGERNRALHQVGALSPGATSSALVGNCCTAGWNCTHEQEWLNGYLAYQNNECGGPPQLGSCCFAGWNCTFDFDWIVGRWAYSDNNRQCFSPIQEQVDRVIVEGSNAFVAQAKSALHRIKSRSPLWYSFVISGALKIRESPGRVGTGTLERSMNIKAGASIAQLARDIVGWTCDLHRWLTRAELSGPEPETPAAVADCATVNLDALQASFS